MGNPLRPLRTSVVRLRYFKKSGTLETEKRIDKKIYKRLYILALTPDGRHDPGVLALECVRTEAVSHECS